MTKYGVTRREEITIKIENLSEGQILKNYNALCAELEVEPKKNNSKKAQLKELDRFIEYYKEGHQIIISKIHKVPKEKVNNTGKSSVFAHIMEILILDYLIEKKKQTVVITRNGLLNHIQAINNNYRYCSENVPQLSKVENIEEKIIYDFYNTTNSNFRANFETVLKNLRNKSLIMYEQVKSICTKDHIHRIANEEEKETILQCEKEVLKEMGFNQHLHSISDVRSSPRWKEFKNKFEKKLRQNSYIHHCYLSYKITVNRNYIEDEYEDIFNFTLDEIEKEGLKQELNGTVMDKLMLNAEMRKNKASDPNTSGKMDRYRTKFSYMKDNNKLVGLLIDNDARDITIDIDKMKSESNDINEMHWGDIEKLFS
ncbi:hypothetical protein [Salipaludibacillus sp. CF4.18]|uniref:hypothetical protein n=1 Tax=Salipaludibacillus sp. CF4.18 TaxID=3373081 RepID=UPI003EE79E84